MSDNIHNYFKNNELYGIIFCDADKGTPERQFENPEYIHILYALSGSFSITCENTEYSINPNEMTSIMPGNIYSLKSITDSGTYCIIYYLPTVFKTIAKIPHLTTDLTYWFQSMNKTPYDVIPLNKKQAIKINDLLAEYKICQEENHKLGCTSLIFSIFTYIGIFLKQSTLFRNGKSTRNVLVNQAMEFIDINYRNNIRVSDVADFLFINQKHLIHIFKLQTGLTIKQYINQKRINYIKNMLENYKMSPKEAFMLSGFNDYSTFYRALKKATGSSPSKLN